MNEASIFHYQKNCFQLLIDALHGDFISERRFQYLIKELHALAYKLALQLNRKDSTSLHKDDYIHILDSISYIVLHGFTDSYDALQQTSITVYYEKGKQCIEQDIEKLKKLYTILQTQRLPFKNDRYIDILDSQIPTYLNTLDTVDAVLNYTYVKDDLDYPLFDGLALYHNMYHLQGSDLMLYYCERLALENAFCYYFIHDLPSFLQLYEKQKGVQLLDIGLNLYGIVLHQVIAYYLLHHTIGIYLTEDDVVFLRQKLMKTSLSTLITSTLQAFYTFFPSTWIQYMETYQEQVVHEMHLFLYDNLELYIYPINQSPEFTVVLTPSEENDNFLSILHHLQSLVDAKEKAAYMIHANLSMYNTLDLLENNIFEELEYDAYFTLLSARELAVLIHVLYPTLQAFHRQPALDEAFFDEMEQSQEWQINFISFLKQLPPAKIVDITSYLHKITIR